MRKFCLNKLQEIFVGIFQRYPLLPSEGDEGEAVVEKNPEELTDEEKEQLKERASRFATELEECMYELYAEPDKTGKQSVAAKYKYVPLSPSGHILLICADHLRKGTFPHALVQSEQAGSSDAAQTHRVIAS